MSQWDDELGRHGMLKYIGFLFFMLACGIIGSLLSR